MPLPPVVVPWFAPVSVKRPPAPVIEPVPVTLVTEPNVIPSVDFVLSAKLLAPVTWVEFDAVNPEYEIPPAADVPVLVPVKLNAPTPFTEPVPVALPVVPVG